MSSQKNQERLHEKRGQQPEPNRTPGSRKLIKEDITTTSVLIRGCTVQTCCRICPTQVG
jgi:hypothetical protein